MQVQGDNDAAIDFLYFFHPDGPWVVTAIQIDKKAIETRTFRPASEASLRRWLEEFNGKRNIYFSVNPPMRDMDKKAEREDIARVEWLHVDIDPRAGEDLDKERVRAQKLLSDNLPKGIPFPTVSVFSGSGCQAFWRLEEPIEIKGDLAKAEDAKRYNQHMELMFGADNTHNIDRIMRLPGTINLPDAKKIKRGRVPELAKVLDLRPELVYPLSVFTPAPAMQMPGGEGFGGGAAEPMVKVSGNIPRLSDVHELDQWGVPDRVKIIIVQGRHPDEPKKGDNSRSAWVFDVCCNLFRFGVPDDVVFSVLTDPGFGISESVLEKTVNAERYALRQMERAKEDAIDPWLRMLNEKHAVIGNLGGKCRVVEEIMDPTLNRTRLTRQSFDDFRNRYMHQQIKIGTTPQNQPIMSPVGKWWLGQPTRRQFESIVFAPGKEMTGVYNLWRGFACTSRPGDCSLFLRHIHDNVCANNDDHFHYLIRWCARMVQRPDTPGEVAVVLRGGRGTGKGFTAKTIGSLLGRHFIHISNPGHLVGNFNSHLRDAVFLFADEAFYAGDRKHASILKTLITEETIQIEAKGVDVESAPNFVHLMMASNDEHVIPAGGDERRFFVLDVGEEAKQQPGYFRPIIEQLASGGREALLHYLLTLDITDFEVRTVPQTSALMDQKLLSLGPEEEWWYQKLLEARPLRHGPAEWAREVRKDGLIDDYIEHTRRFNVSRRGNATTLGKFLGRLAPGMTTIQKHAEWEEMGADGFMHRRSGRVYFWTIPTLVDARQRWDQLYGAQRWPAVGEAQRELPRGLDTSDAPF